ncbi:MAG: hypothetical protein CSYNP_00658 [Syntrophus sp. SKADARSKE-3]|nr:hypothetical protein [Syntrophus sp. SKADARSKE-3]
MNIHRFFFPCRLIVITILILITGTALAQTASPPATDTNRPTGDMDFKTVNQEAVEKLRTLPPDKIANMDDRLADALTLYYDGKFAQALPIFKGLSADVETMDIMWWLGTSAMKVGETKLAIEKFKKMLAVDPKLYRVRLELATAYFETRQYDEARKELNIVKQANPPEEVVKNIDKLLVAIDESSKKVFWNVRFSTGIQWDSNISSGPDQKVLSVTGGTLTLANNATKISDWASIQNFSGNVLYRFSEKQGFMWNTTADVYYQNYFNNGNYNYALGEMTTGLWWVGSRDILKLPVGISKQEYGNSPLSTLYHFRPSVEHFFTPNFSLRGQYSITKESFLDTINDALNNTTYRYEIIPNFYFLNRQHVISAYVGYETANADSRRFTYTAPYGAISYYTRFPTKTDIFLKYQYGERDYKQPPILYTEDRVDRRHSFTAVISQDFLKYFFASFVFNYIDNRSNLDLFSFTKQTYTFSVGFYF